MKYDDPIIEQDNEVHTMIMDMIRPGSKVSEFGAAAGRMTRLLRDNLHCRVTIVEIEETAYRKAMEYAEDGLCGDIEDLVWLEQWRDRRFDYILFVDVLEHLRQPQKILKAVSEILKEDGSVLLSVPNVGHNDLVVKLFDKRFDYTDIGLLDSTHLHFWAEKNLEDICENTDLAVTDIMYKTIPTGGSEQYAGTDIHMDGNLRKALLERTNGEVYQFVVCLKKKAENNKVLNKAPERYPDLWVKMYYDLGEGFNEENTKFLPAKRIACGRYRAEISEVKKDGLTAIRLDFIENAFCLVWKSEVVCGYDQLASVWHGRICDDVGVLLGTPDPYVVWKLPKELEDGLPIQGCVEFCIRDEVIEKWMERVIFNRQKLIQKQENLINKMERDRRGRNWKRRK